jgi:Uncharacterized conserved protein
MTGFIIAAAVVVVCFFTYISLFNTLKTRRNQIENAFSVLDALFIKRSDLIPNLISVAKQYMTFERDTLMEITAQRSPSRTSSEFVNGGETDRIMKQFMVQVENYPDLKTNQQFLSLQYSFNECEEQIAAGRRYLSASITDYNNSVSTFPGNIVAGMSGMKMHEWERATVAQRQNVDAKDLFDN